MAISKDCSFLPPRILTRGVLQLTILIVVALLGVFALSLPAVADLLLFENFQIPDKDNVNFNINGYGAGFGFDGTWSTSSSFVKIITTNSGNERTLASNIPLKNAKTTSGNFYFIENGAGSRSSGNKWEVFNLTRNLTNSIDFSQPGEYYLCFNAVEWTKNTSGAYPNADTLQTVGLVSSSTTEYIKTGMRYSGNETITTKAATGNEVNNTVAGIFKSGLENINNKYTIIEKITVTDASENNVIVSVKAFHNSGTVPTNLTELAGITWDKQTTITSKASFDKLQIDMASPYYGDMSSIRFGTSYGDVTGFLDDPQAGTFTGLKQRSIGLNFTGQNASGGSEKALATSDFAGADGYVQALWNNIRQTTTAGVPYSMLDSVGSMEYYKNQSGYMTVGYSSDSQTLDSLAGTDANSALMSGHANGSTQVTMGAIPYDYYDVVVYMGDNAGSTGEYWITDSEGNKISDTISVVSGAFDGTWTQVKSSGDSGNYYVFRGLTTDSMILNSADGPINAVQIVGHNSTMYLADGDWSNELTVDGTAYQGVQFDSQTSADAKTASHAAGVVLNDNATFQVGNGYTLTQSAPITGTSSVDKTGEGTLVLSGANTYDGETNVYGGTLQLTGDAIDNANGSFTVGTGGTLEYNVASGEKKKLTLTTQNTISGTGKIIKTGAGTFQFDAALGAVDAESLVVSSGELDFKGYFEGNIEVFNGAVFSPGNSIGTINQTGDFTLDTGATLLLEVGKDTDDNILTDILNVTGDTTFEDGSIIEIALDSSYANAFEDGDVANILLPTGIKGSDGNALNLDNLVFQSSLFDLVGYNAGTGYLSVVYSAPAAGVPEPSTWALLLLGAAGLLYVRKRKN